ncbi:MAG: hypothetical protein NT048_01750 [Flavobacterium sp.]|nr:hypothetical protein [Flavobacterium sp.]
MKKITFLVASVLITSGIVNATEYRTNCNFEVPISFMERGIEFFVFPNGEFDFNTRPLDSEGDYFYKTAGKRGNGQERRTMNYGTRIEHDSFGRVRRIGNTFINYDSRDRVNRIGSVYMRYTRFALCQIGNMRIVYNYRGEIVDTVGRIKGYSSSGYAYNYNNHYFDDNYTASSYNDNNSDYYYYKADGTKAKVEDDKERK